MALLPQRKLILIIVSLRRQGGWAHMSIDSRHLYWCHRTVTRETHDRTFPLDASASRGCVPQPPWARSGASCTARPGEGEHPGQDPGRDGREPGAYRDGLR